MKKGGVFLGGMHTCYLLSIINMPNIFSRLPAFAAIDLVMCHFQYIVFHVLLRLLIAKCIISLGTLKQEKCC